MIVKFIRDKDGLIMTLHDIHHVSIRRQSVICYVFNRETDYTIVYTNCYEIDIDRIVYIGEEEVKE